MSPAKREGKLRHLVTPSSERWDGTSFPFPLPFPLSHRVCQSGLNIGLSVLVPRQQRTATAVLHALDELSFGMPLHIAVMALASLTGLMEGQQGWKEEGRYAWGQPPPAMAVPRGLLPGAWCWGQGNPHEQMTAGIQPWLLWSQGGFHGIKGKPRCLSIPARSRECWNQRPTWCGEPWLSLRSPCKSSYRKFMHTEACNSVTNLMHCS